MYLQCNFDGSIFIESNMNSYVTIFNERTYFGNFNCILYKMISSFKDQKLFINV